MCDPVTLAIGGAALAGGSKIMGGVAANKAAKKQAGAEFGQAMIEAKKIRRQGREVRSMARAGQAASGVVVDEGTTALIDADIARRAEEDALNVILTGKNRASTLRKQGKAEFYGSLLDAGGTALSAGSSYTSGAWKK